RRAFRSVALRGIMNALFAAAPPPSGGVYWRSLAGSRPRSYWAAMVWTTVAKPGCSVTSGTRWPARYTWRSSRSASVYSRPLRMAPLPADGERVAARVRGALKCPGPAALSDHRAVGERVGLVAELDAHGHGMTHGAQGIGRLGRKRWLKVQRPVVLAAGWQPADPARHVD